MDKGPSVFLPEEAERIREVVEVGRREDGEEEELFKASLNGEMEFFLESLEYMVDGMVIASADVVRQRPIYIALHRGLSAIAA